MSHRKPRPSGLTSNTTEQIFEYLDRIEAKLDHALSQIDRVKREQRSIANLELSMELENMAEFAKLNAEVTKNTDLIGSIKTMNDGLKSEKAALQAELDALKAADALDQEAVDAAEAKLAAANASLESLAAVVANTPAEPVV